MLSCSRDMCTVLTVYVLLFGPCHFVTGRFAHYLVGSGAGQFILERRSLVYHLRHPACFPFQQRATRDVR